MRTDWSSVKNVLLDYIPAIAGAYFGGALGYASYVDNLTSLHVCKTVGNVIKYGMVGVGATFGGGFAYYTVKCMRKMVKRYNDEMAPWREKK